MLVEKITVDLIFKKIREELDEEEEKVFQEWLAESPEHKEYFSRMKTYYEDYSRGEVSTSEVDDAWKKIVKKTDFRKKTRKTMLLYRYAALAASVLIVFAVVRAFQLKDVAPVIKNEEILPGKYSAILELADGKTFRLGELSLPDREIAQENIRLDSGRLSYINCGIDTARLAVEYNRLSIPRGGEYQLKLEDGTKVWLNSDSWLRYPVTFTQGTREVFLEGEAYFDVERDENRPFIVHAGNQRIKVLGTEFGITCYNEEDHQTVTLVEGRVEVECPEQDKVVLQPGDQLLYHKDKNILECREVNVQEFVAWKDGKYVFTRKRLEDILNTLSRWYDFQVFYQNAACKEIEFTGEVRRFEHFNAILKLIEKTSDVKFLVRQNIVQVMQIN